MMCTCQARLLHALLSFAQCALRDSVATQGASKFWQTDAGLLANGCDVVDVCGHAVKARGRDSHAHKGIVQLICSAQSSRGACTV
jgi:hypothetical protein